MPELSQRNTRATFVKQVHSSEGSDETSSRERHRQPRRNGDRAGVEKSQGHRKVKRRKDLKVSTRTEGRGEGTKRGDHIELDCKKGIKGYKGSDQGNERGALIRKEEGEKCRKRVKGKIAVKMSENVVRNHKINYLPLKTIINTSLCINKHA